MSIPIKIKEEKLSYGDIRYTGTIPLYTSKTVSAEVLKSATVDIEQEVIVSLKQNFKDRLYGELRTEIIEQTEKAIAENGEAQTRCELHMLRQKIINYIDNKIKFGRV